MKTFFTLATTLFLAISSLAQGDLSAAFGRSYKNEAYKKYTEAIADLTPHYEATSYPMNLRLGWLHYLAGDQTKSAVYYEKAIAIEPKSIEARMGLTYPLSAAENWAALERDFKAVLTIDPNNTRAHYGLALMMYNRKEYAKCAEHLGIVLALYPFDKDSLLLSAWCNVSLGEVAKARDQFRTALLFDPENASAKQGLAGLN